MTHFSLSDFASQGRDGADCGCAAAIKAGRTVDAVCRAACARKPASYQSNTPMHFSRCLIFLSFFFSAVLQAADTSGAPLRVLLAGLAHGHAGGFLRQAEPNVVTLVGVWERDDSIWEKYRKNPKLANVVRYTDLNDAVAKSGAEAVWAFSDTRDHLPIVRAVA